MDSSSNSNVSCHDSHSSVLDESSIEDDDVDVFLNYEAVYHEKMKEQVENFDRIIRQLQDEVTSKSSIVEELTTKVSSLQNLILEQADK